MSRQPAGGVEAEVYEDLCQLAGRDEVEEEETKWGGGDVVAASQYCSFETEEKRVHGNSHSMETWENWLIQQRRKARYLVSLTVKHTCECGELIQYYWIIYITAVLSQPVNEIINYKFVSHDGPSVVSELDNNKTLEKYRKPDFWVCF